jgi:DNA polymerase-3 subunit alpha
MFVVSTEFSLGHSLLSTDDVIKTVTDHSLTRVVVTDTMNVNALIPLADKLKEKLVLGVRLTLVDEAEQTRLPIYQPKVYPKDERAMQILYKYLSRAFERPYFYEQPRLDFTSFYQMLREHRDGFMVSTGDINSLISHVDWKEHLENIIETVYDNNLILDICPLPSAKFDRINYQALNWYEEPLNKGAEINLYVPALYKKEDADVFPIHFSISKNVEFNYLKPNHNEYYYDPDKLRLVSLFRSCLSRLDCRYNFKPTGNYKRATFDGMYRWQPQEPRLPQLSKAPMQTLRNLAIAGFKSRLTANIYGYQPDKAELPLYADRLKEELEVIDRLGFSNYFLMVFELTHWCKKQGIRIGPGRGSVGGSLIAYCMGITDVDPIRFGLMFERFINPTRLDLPDIDLDFMSTRRHEIVEHLNDRYGVDNVAGIINYSSLQSRSALRSTCRILGLPDSEYQCSKLIPAEFGKSAKLEEAAQKVIEIKNFTKAHPDVWAKALKLEGKMRNYSTHAAGIIVSDRPLIQDAVIEYRQQNRIINWDKKLCEKQGLIKLDVLGLSTLDTIDLCLQYVLKRHKTMITLEDIPLDDVATLDAFANGVTGGVFQFEGSSVKRLLKDLSKNEPLTFDDLVAANALNRPGPIEAGLVEMYVDGKNGAIHDVDHTSMEDILAPTFNVMVYQEQIMKVAVDFAGYTLPESDNLRKIMGKKLPEEMKKEEKKFVDGCISTHGVDPNLANRVFDQISKFAFYAFNKSHSVEYSLLSYICMWLKVNYPAEFYAATLTYLDDKKVRAVINEAKKMGITVDAPSINDSTDKFNPVSSNRIVAPLNKIKYVAAAAAHIMLERDTNGLFKSVEDLETRTMKRLVNSRVVGSMLKVGALDEIVPLTAPVDPVERSKALNEYLPSIPLGNVCIARKPTFTTGDRLKLSSYLSDVADKMGDNYVKSFMGKDAKYMVVFDAATKTEAKTGMFTDSKGFASINLALYKNSLSKADAYWTGLVKREKEKKEKTFDNKVLEESFKILVGEIEILKPTCIVCLGTQVARMFEPSLKGGPLENSGKVIYSKELDCNILIGFNPSMLFFNPDLEENLNELFETVESLIT